MFNCRAPRRIALAIVVVVSWLAGWAASAGAETVAMVTDAAGGVTLQAGSGRANITILAEIDANTRLQLAPAANLVVMYLRSGARL